MSNFGSSKVQKYLKMIAQQRAQTGGVMMGGLDKNTMVDSVQNRSQYQQKVLKMLRERAKNLNVGGLNMGGCMGCPYCGPYGAGVKGSKCKTFKDVTNKKGKVVKRCAEWQFPESFIKKARPEAKYVALMKEAEKKNKTMTKKEAIKQARKDTMEAKKAAKASRKKRPLTEYQQFVRDYCQQNKCKAQKDKETGQITRARIPLSEIAAAYKQYKQYKEMGAFNVELPALEDASQKVEQVVQQVENAIDNGQITQAEASNIIEQAKEKAVVEAVQQGADQSQAEEAVENVVSGSGLFKRRRRRF